MPGTHVLETEVESLTEASTAPLPMVADWTVKTDMLGEEGPSPPLGWSTGRLVGFLEWHVAVEIAVAREMGMRQRPFPWRYCMAEPMSSSISFATWCSVTIRVSLEDAVWLRWAPPLPPPAWIQSPPPYDNDNSSNIIVKHIFYADDCSWGLGRDRPYIKKKNKEEKIPNYSRARKKRSWERKRYLRKWARVLLLFCLFVRIENVSETDRQTDRDGGYFYLQWPLFSLLETFESLLLLDNFSVWHTSFMSFFSLLFRSLHIHKPYKHPRTSEKIRVVLRILHCILACFCGITSGDISATRGATAAAPPNLLMLRTCIIETDKWNYNFRNPYIQHN